MSCSWVCAVGTLDLRRSVDALAADWFVVCAVLEVNRPKAAIVIVRWGWMSRVCMRDSLDRVRRSSLGVRIYFCVQPGVLYSSAIRQRGLFVPFFAFGRKIGPFLAIGVSKGCALLCSEFLV